MNKNLIIDVGMHTGKDTEFYLMKGFHVVAIEANPYLVAQARKRLSTYINNSELTIRDIAISDHDGEIEFYINRQHDDWSTTSKRFAARAEHLGTTNEVITVKCTTFDNILRDSGIPYYLKIDIEGADNLCLEALLRFEDRPRYLSVEADLTNFEDAFTKLSLIWQLGYRKFKIVNQFNHLKVKCPNPPLEGRFVDFRFDGVSSGPFGEEAPGEWLGIENTIDKCRFLIKEQALFGAGQKLYGTLLHRLFEVYKREPVGWYDFHARLGDR